MPDLQLTCRACDARFVWTEKDQQVQGSVIPDGSHHPKNCPEGGDDFCPKCAYEIYEVPTECGMCRIKQGVQRS